MANGVMKKNIMVKRRITKAVQVATERFRIATEVLRKVTVGFRRATEGPIREE